MHMIDADELIKRLTVIRDKPYDGKTGFQYRRKFYLTDTNRDRITADIKVIKMMIKEQETDGCQVL